MRDPEVIVALISTVGALVTAIVVEMIRRGRAQKRTDRALDVVLHEIRPNSGHSLHDKVCRIERSVDDVRKWQSKHGERLAAVEARVDTVQPHRR